MGHPCSTYSAVRAERCIRSKDSEQIFIPPPVEGMRMYIATMLRCGILEDEMIIREMRKNSKPLSIPAKAGVHYSLKTLGSRFRGNDTKWFDAGFFSKLLGHGTTRPARSACRSFERSREGRSGREIIPRSKAAPVRIEREEENGG